MWLYAGDMSLIDNHEAPIDNRGLTQFFEKIQNITFLSLVIYCSIIAELLFSLTQNFLKQNASFSVIKFEENRWQTGFSTQKKTDIFASSVSVK